MSRRKRRPGTTTEPATSGPDLRRSAGERAPAPQSTAPRSSRRLVIDLGILTAVFAVTVGIAELAGAANLGVAIGIGQVTFALVLVALLLRA